MMSSVLEYNPSMRGSLSETSKLVINDSSVRSQNFLIAGTNAPSIRPHEHTMRESTFGAPAAVDSKLARHAWPLVSESTRPILLSLVSTNEVIPLSPSLTATTVQWRNN